MWMAGGGVKAGCVYGETDDIGFKIVRDPVHVHDLHATVLHLDEHPDGYEYFRGQYHECLSKGPYRTALQQLACAAMKENITLVHQGDDPQHNTATALHEFLSELEAYCPRDDEK